MHWDAKDIESFNPETASICHVVYINEREKSSNMEKAGIRESRLTVKNGGTANRNNASQHYDTPAEPKEADNHVSDE